jgi:hypothetical protein
MSVALRALRVVYASVGHRTALTRDTQDVKFVGAARAFGKTRFAKERLGDGRCRRSSSVSTVVDIDRVPLVSDRDRRRHGRRGERRERRPPRAAAEDVFAFTSDMRNELKWNPDVQDMHKVTDGPVGLGTPFAAKWKQSEPRW